MPSSKHARRVPANRPRKAPKTTARAEADADTPIPLVPTAKPTTPSRWADVPTMAKSVLERVTGEQPHAAPLGLLQIVCDELETLRRALMHVAAEPCEGDLRAIANTAWALRMRVELVLDLTGAT